MASTSILGIVVGKLYYGKKPCPIILLEVDKNLEVGFYYALLPFDLTVCLWVEGSGEFLLYVEEIT